MLCNYCFGKGLRWLTVASPSSQLMQSSPALEASSDVLPPPMSSEDEEDTDEILIRASARTNSISAKIQPPPRPHRGAEDSSKTQVQPSIASHQHKSRASLESLAFPTLTPHPAPRTLKQAELHQLQQELAAERANSEQLVRARCRCRCQCSCSCGAAIRFCPPGRSHGATWWYDSFSSLLVSPVTVSVRVRRRVSWPLRRGLLRKIHALVCGERHTAAIIVRYCSLTPSNLCTAQERELSALQLELVSGQGTIAAAHSARLSDDNRTFRLSSI